ncbi:MAG: CidA/LrgA family protein [Rikenellaceae bacterium]
MTKELKGIAIILVVYLLGEVLSRLIGGFMPSSVVGMLLLFVLLQLGVVKEESIKSVCGFVLNNMMMLFVPLTVGLMVSYRAIGASFIGGIASLLISTVVVLVVVGFVQQILGRRWRR